MQVPKLAVPFTWHGCEQSGLTATGNTDDSIALDNLIMLGTEFNKLKRLEVIAYSQR